MHKGSPQGRPEPKGEIMSKRTWSQIKTAATEAAGTAWIVGTNPMTGIEEDPRYLTLTDPATLRTIQAYHVDGRTVVCGATVSLRQAAERLAEEIQTAYRFGGLGSFDRLRGLAK